jgi:hypothetical protein
MASDGLWTAETGSALQAIAVYNPTVARPGRFYQTPLPHPAIGVVGAPGPLGASPSRAPRSTISEPFTESAPLCRVLRTDPARGGFVGDTAGDYRGALPTCQDGLGDDAPGDAGRQTASRPAVLADTTPFVSMTVPKANGRGTLDLQVKEVVRKVRTSHGNTHRCRYIVCYNEAEARNDAAAREATLAGLDKALRQGDKAMVGNKGFRRFLKTRSVEDTHENHPQVELPGLLLAGCAKGDESVQAISRTEAAAGRAVAAYRPCRERIGRSAKCARGCRGWHRRPSRA